MPGDHVTKTNPRKVAAGHDPMEKKKKTNPKGLNPSRTYKTAKKTKRTGTNPSTGKKRSATSKKGQITRRKNAMK